MTFREIRNLYSYFPVNKKKVFYLHKIKYLFHEILFIKFLCSKKEYELNYFDFFLISCKNEQTKLILNSLKMSKQLKIVAFFSKVANEFNKSNIFNDIVYLFKLLMVDYEVTISLISIGVGKGWVIFDSFLFYLTPFFKIMKKFYPYLKNSIKKKKIDKETLSQNFKISGNLSYLIKHELVSLRMGRIYFIFSDLLKNYMCFNDQKNHTGILIKIKFIKEKQVLENFLFGKNLPTKIKKKLIYCIYFFKMASLFPNIMKKFIVGKNSYLTLNYKFSMHLKIGLFIKKELKILNLFIFFLNKKYWYVNKIKKTFCRKFFIEIKNFFKKKPIFIKNKSLKIILIEEESVGKLFKKNPKKKKIFNSFISITNDLVKILFENVFSKKFKKSCLHLPNDEIHKKKIFFSFIYSLSVKIPPNVLKKINLIFDIFGKFFLSERKLTKIWLNLTKHRLFINPNIILKKCFFLVHQMTIFSKTLYKFILLEVINEHSIIVDKHFLKLHNYHQKINLVEKFSNSCMVNCFLTDLEVYHIFSRIFAIQRLFLFYVKKNLNLFKFENQKEKVTKKFDLKIQTKEFIFIKIKKLETFYFNFIINLKNLDTRLRRFYFDDESHRNLEKALNFNNFF